MLAARSFRLDFRLWLVPALVAWSRVVGASVVVPLDLPALVGHADRVIVGTVEAQVSRWSADHNAIFTDVTVSVSRALKGDVHAGDRVTVRREGGEVEGIGMKVSGAARFVAGEEVVLFLERRGAAYWTVGMAQGKMHVAIVDGRRTAFRDTAGIEFTEAPAPEPAVRPLDELTAQIEGEVKQAGPTGGKHK